MYSMKIYREMIEKAFFLNFTHYIRKERKKITTNIF